MGCKVIGFSGSILLFFVTLSMSDPVHRHDVKIDYTWPISSENHSRKLLFSLQFLGHHSYFRKDFQLLLAV